MNFISILLIIFGLCLFEIINSVDNAIINSRVLSTMQRKSRRWFLFWGIIFAVFVVRGLLPWIIVWASMPSLGPIGALTATFSNSPEIANIIESSSPILLTGGGIFLLLLFLHWIFLEEKHAGSVGKSDLIRKISLRNRKLLFYLFFLIILSLIFIFTRNINIIISIGALIGCGVFFITNYLKQNARVKHKHIIKGKFSDLSKIIYLEILDATFSIDGVLGAFAFTLSVPLIILGNGVGAFVIRRFTVKNLNKIKKYIYLKDGAMYSILFLGIIMVLNGFGVNVPMWVSPVVTLATVGYFFYKSKRYLNIIKGKKFGR